MTTESAAAFHVPDDKATRLVPYFDRDRAVADLGLEPWTVSQANVE
jgi:hypothetical protein